MAYMILICGEESPVSMKHAFAYVLNMNSNRNPAAINHALCLASQNHTLRELIFQLSRRLCDDHSVYSEAERQLHCFGQCKFPYRLIKSNSDSKGHFNTGGS